jgi:hypothetical protein
MNKFLLIVILLTGCATAGQKQATCESKFTDFADVVTCTKQEIANDPITKDYAEYKAYLLFGDQLAQQVKDKQKSDIDARTEWGNFLHAMQDRNAATAVRKYNATRPNTSFCVPTGGTVSCRYY